MTESKFQFNYEVYSDISELSEQDAWLLTEARTVTEQAYAPYSNFHVGAVAMLENGEVVAGTNQENASYPAALLNNGQLVLGTNQENASYPVGTCAERVLLGTAANQFLDIPISAMAISYQGAKVISDHPISPCGMCRQALLEYETRTAKPIRLILSGQEGKVFIIETASFLLPFAFTKSELK